MWRRDGETGDWFKIEVSKVDEKGRAERFDAEVIKKRHCAPILCVTDEAWQFYPNNGGWSRCPLLSFYARQQRKLRDEWFIVTQHPTDVDSVFWNIAQDFWVCRNHGMERMGIFRQPAMFRVIVYLTNPARGNAIRSNEFYRRLDKKLSQCYDTTAGVGISGGFKGDSNQKKSGIHFAWILVGVAAVVVVLCAVPIMLRKAVTPMMTHTLTGGRDAKPAEKAPKQSLPPPSVSQPSQDDLSDLMPGHPSHSDGHREKEEPLLATGYTFLGGSPSVFLSDGSTVEPPELQFITKTYVLVNGKKLKFRYPKLSEKTDWNVPAPNFPVSPPQVVGTPNLPETDLSPDPRPVNQADVTYIGQAHRYSAPPPLGSFSR
jgi:hypothetical protein